MARWLKNKVDLMDYAQLRDALTLEEVLCLATLIAVGELPYESNVDDSNLFFRKIDCNCAECKYASKCLACSINR